MQTKNATPMESRFVWFILSSSIYIVTLFNKKSYIFSINIPSLLRYVGCIPPAITTFWWDVQYSYLFALFVYIHTFFDHKGTIFLWIDQILGNKLAIFHYSISFFCVYTHFCRVDDSLHFFKYTWKFKRKTHDFQVDLKNQHIYS